MNNSPSNICVDDEIYSCLNLDSPKSFFLFAGAGSGKTRSLVTVLKKFRDLNSQRLRLNGQKVAIITYTNAACDEIKRRLEFDSTFVVSTIHSFAWELIRTFQHDIKDWIRSNTLTEISNLEEQQRKGRAGSKAAIDREKQITAKKKRLEDLGRVNKITYNPNGTTSGRDELNHAEVIKIASEFLSSSPLMQKLFIRKYPILLIDESQDTKKELIDAFFTIQSRYSSEFCLGLFGDTMQRIYMDGKVDLGENLPDGWITPSKIVNYRCPKRIISLINKIRGDQPQEPSEHNTEGIVRLFIIDSNSDLNKQSIESGISRRMVELTNDAKWCSDVKVLTLEHHMAARRSGFIDFFEPLYNMTNNSTGLLDGTLTGMSFFIQHLLPLIKARQSENDFAVASILKKYSPLLHRKKLKSSLNAIENIKNAKEALDELLSLWSENSDPLLYDILQKTAKLDLLPIPDILLPIALRSPDDYTEEENEEILDKDNVIEAWDRALKSPFSQLESYKKYISDESSFGTHQGVKGLEFERVMVILDDEEARGFLFNYEKLLGAKSQSNTDINNTSEGKENSIDRTRRLFYVTCSRAEKSLAIVAYTKNPQDMKNYTISQNWFSEDEVVLWPS